MQQRRADRLANRVQRRLIAASWIAPAVLLGPLVLTLMWLSHRLDPAKANPPLGTDFTMLATVSSDFHNPVATRSAAAAADRFRHAGCPVGAADP